MQTNNAAPGSPSDGSIGKRAKGRYIPLGQQARMTFGAVTGKA